MRVLMSEALPFTADIRVGSHHYADRFIAHGHDVFWVGFAQHALSVARGLCGSNAHRDSARNWRHGPVPIAAGSWAYQPTTVLPFRDLPLLDSGVVLRSSLRFTVPPIGSVLRRFGFARPDVLWLSQASGSAALARVDAHRVVYRISDRWRSFAGVPPSLHRAEQKLLERADVVLVTARALLDEIPDWARRKATYLPNGVDCERFRAAAEEPPELARIPRPRILFAGTIGEWVDVPAIIGAARALPDMSFVLVGPAQGSALPATVPSNLHPLGPRPYTAMPAFMRACEVGLVPFRVTPLTDAVSPVKLFEYFAAGLPVVSTRLAEVERLGSPALLASDSDELVERVREALALGRDRSEYHSFASANTWEARFSTVLQVIG